MTKTYQDLNPPSRILLGPGPSNVHPRVLRAMATPMIGTPRSGFSDYHG